MKKLFKRNGESLIESLVAFGVLAIIMIAFPILISKVNKLNYEVKSHNIAYSRDTSDANKKDVTVTITDISSAASGNVTYKYSNVQGYKDSDDYYYYEFKK